MSENEILPKNFHWCRYCRSDIVPSDYENAPFFCSKECELFSYVDQSIKSIAEYLCGLEDRIDKLEHNNKEQEECLHLMDGDTCILCEYTPKNCKDKENEQDG